MFRLSAIVGIRMWACLALVAYAGAVNHELILEVVQQAECHDHHHDESEEEHEHDHAHHEHDCALCAAVTFGEVASPLLALAVPSTSLDAAHHTEVIRTADVHALLPDLRGPPTIAL